VTVGDFLEGLGVDKRGLHWNGRTKISTLLSVFDRFG
jgi:hypothetical protein